VAAFLASNALAAALPGNGALEPPPIENTPFSFSSSEAPAKFAPFCDE